MSAGPGDGTAPDGTAPKGTAPERTAPAVVETDPFEPRFARLASGLLRDFNRAGVLSAADVHVARELGRLAGEQDESVLLAVALAVRGPRLGHVHVDLRRIRATAAVDTEDPVDLDTLAWPEPEAWVTAVAASPLAAPDAAGGAGPPDAPGSAEGPIRPLRMTGEWLYLDRYWTEEVQVARSLQAMAEREVTGIDDGTLADGLDRLFGGDERRGDQARAAEAAVRRPFAVVAGGPGTGKTTTVARIVALLGEQALASGAPLPLVALAAPTGKAAARLQAAVAEQAAGLDVPDAVREQLLGLPATTLHRLLGWRPGSSSRFRHNRQRRLPHDLVIIDETSMVSLSLMARLIEALRAEARLVLVGDPGQLASIEAGAVLGDIVGPAAGAPETTPDAGPIGAGIVVLERGHRFGAGIGALATAIRAGDADAVMALLRDPPDDVRWIDADVAAEPELPAVRGPMVDAARTMIEAARDGRGEPALDALGAFRILCAHRRGPYGVSTWTARTEGWLEAELPGLATGERWYPGRPLLVTENDYELGLNNGDTGVVIQEPERLVAAFERGGAIARYSPTRLGPVETVYAMTIHKSQGSQFGCAAVLLPDPDSRILTRELLYTAATRAQRALILVGTEETVRAAVQRPVARASGLRRRLWPDAG